MLGFLGSRTTWDMWDIVGTETYLNATPEPLQLAAHRLHRRYRKAATGEEHSV
jgi:hypothetical protein